MTEADNKYIENCDKACDDSLNIIKKVNKEKISEEIAELEKRIQEKELKLHKLNLQRKCVSGNTDVNEAISTWKDVCLNALNDLYDSLKNNDSFPSINAEFSHRELLIRNLGLDPSLIKVDNDLECFYIN